MTSAKERAAKRRVLTLWKKQGKTTSAAVIELCFGGTLRGWEDFEEMLRMNGQDPSNPPTVAEQRAYWDRAMKEAALILSPAEIARIRDVRRRRAERSAEAKVA